MFGQTERSPGTIAVKPLTALFLLQPSRGEAGGAGAGSPGEPPGLLWEGRHLLPPQQSGMQARTLESRNHTDVPRPPPERLLSATLSRWGSGILSLTREALGEGRALGSAK